jgi:hypothetical protein
MKDINYVQFEELYSMRLSLGAAGDSSAVTAKVYTRKTIATGLGLTESQLIEFAILAGNDFTAGFQKEEFRWSSQGAAALPPAKWRHDEMLDFMQTTSPSFQLESRNSSLQLAIDFSRDFYELRDLSRFPVDPPLDLNMPLSLSADMKEALQTWITETLGAEEGATFEGVGTIALAFLDGVVEEGGVGSFGKYVKSQEQVDALSAMQRRVKEGSLELESERKKKRHWDDVMFLSCYQLVCRELMHMLVTWPATADMIQESLLEVRTHPPPLLCMQSQTFDG